MQPIFVRAIFVDPYLYWYLRYLYLSNVCCKLIFLFDILQRRIVLMFFFIVWCIYYRTPKHTHLVNIDETKVCFNKIEKNVNTPPMNLRVKKVD